jgi:CHASE2 domain-containing sensor protein
MSRPHVEPKDNYLSHLKRGMIVVFVIALIMLGLSWRGLLHQWEMFGVDPLLSSRTFKSDIRLVEITDDDYAGLFEGRSPLSRQKLDQLIMAVAGAHPELVVVDLDVSDLPDRDLGEKPKPLPEQVQDEISGLPERKPVVIWAQPVKAVAGASRCPESNTPPAGILSATLAGVQSDERGQSDQLGVPLFPRDRDGVVRSYLRRLPIFNEQYGTCASWPTLPWAAHLASTKLRGGTAHRDHPETDDELYLNFSGDRYVFALTDAGSVLSETSSSDGRDKLATGLEGKTVIIGGTFEAARDRYFTPLGEMPGLELIAFALESENQGTGIRHGKEVFAFAFDLVVGVAIVSIWFRWKGWPAIWSSIGIAIVLPIVCSYLLFSSWNFFLSFVPVAIGAMAHVAVDAVVDLPKKEKKIECLKKCIEAKDNEIESLRKKVEPQGSDLAPEDPD